MNSSVKPIKLADSGRGLVGREPNSVELSIWRSIRVDKARQLDTAVAHGMTVREVSRIVRWIDQIGKASAQLDPNRLDVKKALLDIFRESMLAFRKSQLAETVKVKRGRPKGATENSPTDQTPSATALHPPGPNQNHGMTGNQSIQPNSPQEASQAVVSGSSGQVAQCNGGNGSHGSTGQQPTGPNASQYGNPPGNHGENGDWEGPELHNLLGNIVLEQESMQIVRERVKTAGNPHFLRLALDVVKELRQLKTSDGARGRAADVLASVEVRANLEALAALPDDLLQGLAGRARRPMDEASRLPARTMEATAVTVPSMDDNGP